MKRSLFVLLIAACGTTESPKAAAEGEATAAAPAGEAAAAQATGPDGTAAAAPAAGKREDVEVDALAKAIETGPVTLLDVRTKEEYDGGHVKGAVLVPVDEVDAAHPAIKDLPKDKPVYVICQVGGRSSQAADELAAAGFHVVNVKGGTGAWIASGRPVE